MRSDPEDFLPLTPSVLHILLALAEAPLHGYGIVKATEARTGGRAFLGPGNLYGSIKKMLESGLIKGAESASDDADAFAGPRRKHYQLTDLGRRVAALETSRLASLVRWARASDLLGEEGG